MGGTSSSSSASSSASSASSSGGAASTAGSIASGIGTAVAIGSTVTSLLQNADAQKQQMEDIRYQQQSAVNSRKNLLDKQLASRRVMLASMGVSLDGSNKTSQQAIIDDGYTDINDTNYAYDNKYQKAYDEYKSDLFDGVLSLSSKVIK